MEVIQVSFIYFSIITFPIWLIDEAFCCNMFSGFGDPQILTALWDGFSSAALIPLVVLPAVTPMALFSVWLWWDESISRHSLRMFCTLRLFVPPWLSPDYSSEQYLI